MHILRAVVIFGVLLYLLIAGGPVLGVMISSTTFLVPILFVVAIVALAIWKLRDLVRRKA